MDAGPAAAIKHLSRETGGKVAAHEDAAQEGAPQPTVADDDDDVSVSFCMGSHHLHRQQPPLSCIAARQQEHKPQREGLWSDA